MVAPPITRWVFHPGSGRWGHPRDIRVLTIREAARIQSFPDSFEFVGTYNNQAGQLGNAIPPLLARRIAEEVWDQLEESRRSTRSRNSASESLCERAGKSKLIA
jgi:DNA (cytosine-5)-methyltransferase 1